MVFLDHFLLTGMKIEGVPSLAKASICLNNIVWDALNNVIEKKSREAMDWLLKSNKVSCKK